jgi:GAF domain-containing protein
MGCLRIRFDRGVCGACARERRSIVVPDVHAFPGHIACDSASASEIVVPVLDAAGELIAVLDVDSTLPAAFDETDREHLERIVGLLSGRENRAVVATK